jgi:hypothetical protein
MAFFVDLQFIFIVSILLHFAIFIIIVIDEIVKAILAFLNQFITSQRLALFSAPYMPHSVLLRLYKGGHFRSAIHTPVIAD